MKLTKSESGMQEWKLRLKPLLDVVLIQVSIIFLMEIICLMKQNGLVLIRTKQHGLIVENQIVYSIYGILQNQHQNYTVQKMRNYYSVIAYLKSWITMINPNLCFFIMHPNLYTTLSKLL